MTKDGTIYPVTLHIAKARDERNILYDVNVKINEGIAADKIATSLRAEKQARQAVRTTKPSGDRITQHNEIVKKFSNRDSNGNQLSEDQKEFFENSKARDESGMCCTLCRNAEWSPCSRQRLSP
jgi:hypothetical protein